MSSVDSRIVSMKFDNASFERGAATSLSTLQKLKQNMDITSAVRGASTALGGLSGALGKLGVANPFSAFLSGASRGLGILASGMERLGGKNHFVGAQQGIADTQKAVNQFTMAPMEGQVTHISKSFVAMSTIAITALSNITNKMTNMATNLAKEFTITPVSTGLAEYEQTLNATQTIMSGTGESVEQVTKTLADLNAYSDRTIYAFGDMTSNIKHFTNAGLSSEKAARVMKGIANATASAGGSANEAARAMLGFGQSMSMGYVGLMDWNQVDNAGVATKEFKEQLIQSGIAAGTLTKGLDGTVRTTQGTEVSFKNLRMTLQDQWLTSDALVSTLDRYSDTSTEVGKKAAMNATRIKTLTQLMDVMKEGVQSGWSQSFQYLFGNLEEASKLWTGVGDAIGGMLDRSAKGRNKMLKDWKELGGRKDVIEGIKNIWEALGTVLTPIKEAFRDIFPAKTGADLAAMSENFRNFTEKLKLGEDTMANLKSTFKGVFAVFSIVGQVIGAVVGAIKDLIGSASGAGGSFLEFTGGIGEAIASFDTFLEKTGILKTIFSGIADVLKVPIALIGSFASMLAKVFFGFDAGRAESAGEALGRFGDRLKSLESVGDRVSKFFERLGELLSGVGDVIGAALSGIGTAIGKAFSAENFGHALDAVNTGLLGALVIMIKRFFNDGVSVDLTGGLGESIKESLGGVTDALNTMQTNLKADVLMKIAISLGILAASIAVLSMIDPKRLASAMTGMTVGFAGMQVAMVSLAKAFTVLGVAKLPIISAAMIGLATAMLIFAVAIRTLASLRIDQIAKGLIGIGAMLWILSKAITPLTKDSKGIFRVSAALILLGVAMNIMAVALKIMASLSWEEMAKGLLTLAGTLAILVAAVKLMPNLQTEATSILILSAAITVLAVALKIMASLSWEEMAKGLLTLAGTLAIIVIAMKKMPKGMLAQSAALVAVATAINIMGVAIKQMGNMGWENIAKGLVTLALGLFIIAAALKVMNGTLAGSAALVVAAAALAVIAPVLVTLGSLSWESIAKGLLALAGAFTVIGVAGYLLAPVIPIILGLGASFLMIGAGVALVGAGMALAGAGLLSVATALSMIAAVGIEGVSVLSAALKSFIDQIPAALAAFGKGIVDFAKEIGKGGPAFVQAATTLIGAFLDGVIKNAPKFEKAVSAMVKSGLKILVDNIPRIADAGLKLIIGFLTAIDNNIDKIIPLAVSITVKFINGVADGLPKIIQAGVNLVIKFVNGVADAIRNNSEEMGRAGGNLATAMVEGMVKGLRGGAGAIADAAMDAARAAWDSVRSFFKMKSPSRRMMELGKFVNEGFAMGLEMSAPRVVGAMETKVLGQLETMLERIKTVASESAAEVEAMKDKLKQLKKAKNPDEKAIKKAKNRLARAKKEEDAARSALKTFKKNQKEEQDLLRKQGMAWDELQTKIEEAQKAYDDALAAKENHAKQVESQFNVLPDIQRQTSVTRYLNEIQKQTDKTNQFYATLERLRGMGLDDASYQKFISEGPDALPFLDKLVAAGPAAVESVDQATAQLAESAKRLGEKTAAELYDSGLYMGEQSKKGILDGLLADQKALEDAMAQLANKMMQKLKKKLKIKSPSREFALIGKYTTEGLAEGITAYSGLVEKATEGVGGTAIDTLKSTVGRIGDAVSSAVDANPSITPVLDLSLVKKEAGKIGNLMPDTATAATLSYSQASSILAEKLAARASSEEASTTPVVKEIKYEQNNYSPKALSATEIYRNSKSLFAMAKEELV